MASEGSAESYRVTALRACAMARQARRRHRWYNGSIMPRIPARELEGLPLRAHDLLAGVPLHDAWAVDLPRWRAGITLDEFLRAAGGLPFKPSRMVRVLLALRFAVGRLFNWDREDRERERASTAGAAFVSRMTAADTARSLVPPGSPRGPFRVVYCFENEELLELRNRTAHAGALSALVEGAQTYRFYFGVYVRAVGRFTPVYMAVIAPFRRLIVYPSLLRSVRASWDHAFRPRGG